MRVVMRVVRVKMTTSNGRLTVMAVCVLQHEKAIIATLLVVICLMCINNASDLHVFCAAQVDDIYKVP